MPSRCPYPGESEHSGRLLIALSVVVLTAAVLQTGVVPILSAIADQLHASRVAVGWVVTANLLAAAATTPLIGRLADLHNKKSVLLGTLGVVLAGSLLGAVTSSLPLLVLCRALQGTSFAVFPVAVSILRDELPADRLLRAIGVVSATLGLGTVLALLFTGFLMPRGADYHRVFWLLAALSAVAVVGIVLMVPSRPRPVTERVDWWGAAGLSTGLCAVMVAITQGKGWGWTSPRTLSVGVAGAAVLALWWSWMRRCRYPLVSVDLLRHRGILLTNSASFLVGMGSYFSLLGLSACAATPVASGHGFGADVGAVSLQFLLPGALAATLAAMLTGRLIERFGAYPVMIAGGFFGVIGFVLFIGWHSSRGQLLAAGLLTSIYLSLAYGALTAMVVSYVPASQTGVANSLNGICSKIGGSTAAAAVAPLVGSGGGGSAGYTVMFLTGALTTVGAVLSTVLVRTPGGFLRSGDVRLTSH